MTTSPAAPTRYVYVPSSANAESSSSIVVDVVPTVLVEESPGVVVEVVDGIEVEVEPIEVEVVELNDVLVEPRAIEVELDEFAFVDEEDVNSPVDAVA
jgi:hypothetical protein